MKVALACGTRPERIKMEPIARALEERGVTVLRFETVQSPDLVDGKAAQGISWSSLHGGIASVLTGFKLWAQALKPDAVLVQGDTATAYSVALSAFLMRLPVGHVEAGLRTYAAEPFPEEALRRMIAPLARWHFAPDEHSAHNLCYEMQRSWGAENDREVFVVGNPVIDTLPPARPQLLVTLHRRENWGPRITEALKTLDRLAQHPSKPVITVITHPNWGAWQPEGFLDGFQHLYFHDPMPAERFRAALRLSDIIVTDSGGLQEEAAYYGKPCIVLRTATERASLARNGAVALADPDDPGVLRGMVGELLDRRVAYGTGDAGARIADILCKELGHA